MPLSDNSMVWPHTDDWLFLFKFGKTSFEDCEHSVHPSTGCTGIEVQKGEKLVNEDQ